MMERQRDREPVCVLRMKHRLGIVCQGVVHKLKEI